MIRLAVATDNQRMHEIHTHAVRTACQGFYSDEQIDGWLINRSPEGYLEGINKNAMYVYIKGNKTVGFGHAEVGEIHAIFVDPEFHKQGIGKSILEYGLKIALGKSGNEKVKVEASINAVNFYTQHGFAVVKEKHLERNGQQLPITEMEYSPSSHNTS